MSKHWETIHTVQKSLLPKKKGLNAYMGGMGLETISYIKITSSYWSSGPILPGELVSKVA